MRRNPESFGEEDLELIYIARGLNNLDSEDRLEQMAAIDLLGGNLQPIVKNRLKGLLAQNDDGSPMEADAVVYKKAEKALAKIESKVNVYKFFETTFFGLSLGSVLLLSAIGLAITFGVLSISDSI